MYECVYFDILLHSDQLHLHSLLSLPTVTTVSYKYISTHTHTCISCRNFRPFAQKKKTLTIYNKYALWIHHLLVFRPFLYQFPCFLRHLISGLPEWKGGIQNWQLQYIFHHLWAQGLFFNRFGIWAIGHG